MIHQVPEHKLGRLLSAGVGTLLGILFFVGVASVTDPQNFLNMAGRSLEAVKHNLNQESVPRKANAEVEFKRRDQHVVIQYGATIYQIANEVYGANAGPRYGPHQRVQPANQQSQLGVRRTGSLASFPHARDIVTAAN